MQLIAGLFANTGVISEACLPEQAVHAQDG